VSDRCRIWKSMLDEGADGGVAVGHGLLEYPEHIPKARRVPRSTAAHCNQDYLLRINRGKFGRAV
jgi:hypothetical protein